MGKKKKSPGPSFVWLSDALVKLTAFLQVIAPYFSVIVYYLSLASNIAIIAFYFNRGLIFQGALSLGFLIFFIVLNWIYLYAEWELLTLAFPFHKNSKVQTAIKIIFGLIHGLGLDYAYWLYKVQPPSTDTTPKADAPTPDASAPESPKVDQIVEPLSAEEQEKADKLKEKQQQEDDRVNQYIQDREKFLTEKGCYYLLSNVQNGLMALIVSMPQFFFSNYLLQTWQYNGVNIFFGDSQMVLLYAIVTLLQSANGMFSLNLFQPNFNALDCFGWQLLRASELFVKATLFGSFVQVITFEQLSYLSIAYISYSLVPFFLVHNYSVPCRWYQKILSLSINIVFNIYTRTLYFNFKESPLLFKSVETCNALMGVWKNDLLNESKRIQEEKEAEEARQAAEKQKEADLEKQQSAAATGAQPDASAPAVAVAQPDATAPAADTTKPAEPTEQELKDKEIDALVVKTVTLEIPQERNSNVIWLMQYLSLTSCQRRTYTHLNQVLRAFEWMNLLLLIYYMTKPLSFEITQNKQLLFGNTSSQYQLMASIVVQLGVFGYYYGSMIRTVYYRDYDRLNFDE